ncbi:MAG: hypothetical protein ACYTFM_00465 [Planctomycetota bacterium]|jgi:hypothetical protein
MKKTAFGVIIVLGLLFCSAFLKSKTDFEVQIDQFLSRIINGEIDKAYDELLIGTMLAERAEAIGVQKQQTSQLFDTYGRLLEKEFVKKQQYGKSLIRLVYILKCEKMPLVWEFYYYKTEGKWQLISLKLRDDLDMLADK